MFSTDMRGMAVVQGAAAAGNAPNLVLMVDRAAYALRVVNVRTGVVRTLAQVGQPLHLSSLRAIRVSGRRRTRRWSQLARGGLT